MKNKASQNINNLVIESLSKFFQKGNKRRARQHWLHGMIIHIFHVTVSFTHKHCACTSQTVSLFKSHYFQKAKFEYMLVLLALRTICCEVNSYNFHFTDKNMPPQKGAACQDNGGQTFGRGKEISGW